MTNRISHLTVVLKKEIREDDIDGLAKAILHMKNVLSVETNIADDINLSIADMRVRSELSEKLMDVLYPSTKTGKGS